MGGLDRLVPLIAGPAIIDPGASVIPHARKLTAATRPVYRDTTGVCFGSFATPAQTPDGKSISGSGREGVACAVSWVTLG